MGKVPVRAECCQTCIHWESRDRKTVDDGNQVDACFDYQHCSICDSLKEWREWCASYTHYNWVRNTYRPSRESLRTPTELYVDSVTKFLMESRKRKARTPQKVTRTCTRCNGTGHVQCTSCGGRGVHRCGQCDGKGGFITELSIREDFETFHAKRYWLPDVNVPLTFYGFHDEAEQGLTPDDYANCHVLCDKEVVVAYKDGPFSCVSDVLKIGDADLDYPAELPGNMRSDIYAGYEDACRRIDKKIEDWGDGVNCRIKWASFKCTQTYCIVKMQFKDALGFPYTALVNLANHDVHLCEIDKEAAASRLAELETMANAGDAEMQNTVGMLYAHYGSLNVVVDKDNEKAFLYFLKAAKSGHSDAMDNLGNCYNNGDGVEEDKELAFDWYQKAAKCGLAYGQYHVARCFLNGAGTEKDNDMALLWYLRAAKQSLPEAQMMVGRCAEEGWGMEKDPDFAFLWMSRAAENGHATAMNNLANFYARGFGCEKDSEKESVWRAQAEAHGYVKPSGW